jgi:putative membrane-bound dehydrogenase-like protein
MLLLAALAVLQSEGPLPAEEAARAAKVADGFRVTLSAAEPEVIQPIGMAVDDRGRVWVAEAHAYPNWKPEGSDRLLVFEDADGDGRFDRRTVFFEGLNYVTGIEVGFGGVWVMSPPNFLFIPDRDGDDRPDGPPEVRLDGFGYKESHHNIGNGFTWGPDGWLYAGHGRTSLSDPAPPGTPAEKRVRFDGGVWRYHPVKGLYEPWADGTTNPWGVDFDDYGQMFVSNCVNPHLFHMIQGAHYEPWRGRVSSRFAYQRVDTVADHLHWQGGNLGRAAGAREETSRLGGGHAHCGTHVYLGDMFPEDYRNSVFMVNVHGRRINRELLERRGSGYVARHGRDLLQAADPWFMGSVLQAAPDGGLYVTDWSDTGECHTYKPHRETGRIFKVAYGEPRRARPDVAALSDAELVALQLHRNDWHVRHARRVLQERAAAGRLGGEVRPALEEILDRNPDVTRRLRALWALRSIDAIPQGRLRALLDHPAGWVRAWTVQFELEDREVTEETLRKLESMAASDPSPEVRLYLAAGCRRLPAERRWGILAGLAGRAEDAADPNLPLLIWYAAEPLAEKDPRRAMELVAETKLPHLRTFMARRIAEFGR